MDEHRMKRLVDRVRQLEALIRGRLDSLEAEAAQLELRAGSLERRLQRRAAGADDTSDDVHRRVRGDLPGYPFLHWGRDTHEH